MRCRMLVVGSGVVLAALAAAGCGASGDAPALAGPVQASPSPGPAVGGGPQIGVVTVGSVEAPVVGGAHGAAITAAARTVATGLAGAGRACPVVVARSDARVVSFRWECTDHSLRTATFATATGTQLALSQLLTGSWVPYLSATARVQLEAAGASVEQATAATAPDPAAYDRWDLTPTSLEVAFALPGRTATLAFPLATLGPYLAPGSVAR